MFNRKTEPALLVFGLLLIVIAIAFIVDGAKRHQQHMIVKDNLIQVSAEVSEIHVFEDSDEGADQYTASVTYCYDGKVYKDIGWKWMGKGEYWVGQNVTITINPDDPSTPYRYKESSGSDALLFFIIGCGMIALSFHLSKKNSF